MVHLTGETRISFGKYIGTQLRELPPGYLLYMYDKGYLFDDLKGYVDKNRTTLEAEKKRAMKDRYK